MQSDGTDRMYRFLSILAASNQLLHSLPRLQSFPSVPADFPAGEGTSQVQETSLFNSFLQGAQVQFCFLPQFFVFFFFLFCPAQFHETVLLFRGWESSANVGRYSVRIVPHVDVFLMYMGGGDLHVTIPSLITSDFLLFLFFLGGG